MKIRKGDRVGYAKKMARQKVALAKRSVKRRPTQGVILVIPTDGTHPGAVYKQHKG